MNINIKFFILGGIVLISYIFLINYNYNLEKENSKTYYICLNGSLDEKNNYDKFFCGGEIIIHNRPLFNNTEKNITIEDLNKTWQKIIR